jgi:diguanylate cyclase (GGDEF)-like protein
MFLDIYGTPNRILGETAGVSASSWSQLLVGMNRLYEEMGELAEAIRLEHISPIAVSSELADVFAWMMAVANVLPDHLEDNEFNLELALWDQYPGNCNYCFADRCVCLNDRVRQSLIASIGPDTPQPIDHLTTLPRRDTFEKELTETVLAATDRFPVSLIVLDLDNFKVVNDRWSHSVGDTVLRGVALLLKELAELFHGRAYRWGGEEFTILLTGEAADKAVECATEILSRSRSRVFEFDDGSKHRQTLSAGIATLRHSPTKPLSVVTRDFFQAADKAVYQAKSSGRDQVSTAKEDWL